MNTASTLPTPRFNMVEQQVRPWEVLDDRVLNLLLELPRELFVPAAYRGLAYADTAIPLGHGHAMLEPRLVGRMVQALDIVPGDRILEIGTGSGYVTACLARLGEHVLSWEIHEDLAEQARANLRAAEVSNIEVHTGDGLNSAIDEGPFDALIVTGSCPTYPEHLEALIKTGGRMMVVVGADKPMSAYRVTRESDSACARESLFETLIAPMENTRRPSAFIF
ncbi:MAG TPA: protein-L-isoaspartate O-methyltransferase [Chromatiaceae bacterium]|nr:protein-L-isoaspartate O-methyltransferase [Chromatiaceae bacterium]